MNYKKLCLAVIALALFMPVTTVVAKDCGNTSSGFNAWMERFKKRAKAKGITDKTLRSALGGVRYSNKVIGLDRNQRSMKLSFDKFWKLRVNNALIRKGRRWIANNKSLADRIEKKYGVPIEVPVSIWGLETSYGGYKGMMLPIFTSLATLSYDCRRQAFFTKNLVAALRIVQRGDMRPRNMRGAWAGEIGMTQFMAEAYWKYAVDFDGNGRRDLINSEADVLASTANYLKGYGWRRGSSWKPGTHNYQVLREWNKAGVYVKAISKMADMMASNKPLKGGSSGRKWSSGSSSSTGGFVH